MKPDFTLNLLRSFLAILTFCVFSILRIDGATGNSYNIAFTNSNPPIARITASIPLSNDDLEIHRYGSSGEKDGWATFVKKLQVTSKTGKKLSVEKSERLKWKINGDGDDIFNIEYEVEFPYAMPEYSWSGGPRSTAAYFDGKALFLLARTLFIYNNAESPTEVCFNLPDKWKVSTPWTEKMDNKPDCYTESSLEKLMDNVIVVGNHKENKISRGNFNANIVFVGYDSEPSALVTPVFNSIVRSYTKLFNYNEKSKFLLVMFRDRGWETGEGYNSSFAIIAPRPPTESDRVVWANSIAHETFHYWNGQRLRTNNWEDTNWFSEGFTEYFANLTLVRNGIITERQFLNFMQKHLMLYINFRFYYGTPYERYSLVEAGSHKSNYNVPIYDGGWTAAFCLDTMIREATQNEKGLDDVMRILYDEFAGKDKKYTNDDILRICNEVSESNFTDFFEQYIYGKKMMPVESFMNKAGFEGSATIYGVHILSNLKASSLENAIRAGIMRGN